MFSIKANPNRITFLALMLVCVFGAGVCFAQSSDANGRLQTAVSYSCDDMPIGEALKELARQAEVYIVLSPQVTGNVTIEVVDVPLEELLTNVLGAYNYTFIATKNMVRIVPLSETATMRETLITQIYKITYADASEVSRALADFVSLNGKVSFNKGTSHIIVTETEDKIKAISKFIEEIDKATPQVVVEVRIYDITSEEAFEIEAEWDAMNNEHLVTTEHNSKTTATNGIDADTVFDNLSKLPQSKTTTDYNNYQTEKTDNYGSVTTTDNSNGYTNTDNSDGYTNTDDKSGFELNSGNYFEDQTEIFGAQNSTETFGAQSNTNTIGAYTNSELENHTDTKTETETTSVAGFNLDDYKNNTVSKSTKNKSYTTQRRKPKFGASFDKKNGGTIRISLLDNAIDLDFALSMLHSTVEAKLLASPRVMVLDNETAMFQTVREVPYTERTTDGGSTLTSTKFKAVGVQLDVTPHVARDGMVRLKVKPEFGVVVDIDENGAPTIETRKTETTALIRDGQTIVLAGLRKKEIKKGVDKMPLLGDLPLLGGLFRAESEEEITSELVVFITTRIVTEGGMTEMEQNQYAATNFGAPMMTGNQNLENERRRSKAAIARDEAKKAAQKAAIARGKARKEQADAARKTAKKTASVKAPKAKRNVKTTAKIESDIKAQAEIIEAIQNDRALEPIEAEPMDSSDFIKQWMRKTNK